MSARITMPAPPPAGVSSTERCLSVAKSRMSIAASAHLPSPSAFPARLNPKGPGNISGKMVRTVARHMEVPINLRHCPALGDRRHGASLESQELLDSRFRGNDDSPASLEGAFW